MGRRLVTPERVGMVARMMQAVGRSYVRYVNDTLGRTGRQRKERKGVVD